MKKKILMKCLIGAPIGLTISTLFTIVASINVGDGNFYPVGSSLISDCGNELNAVIIQTLCSLLYGSICTGASVIYEKEDWSILHQTIVHLLICSLSILPIAYFMHWMHPSLLGILIYFGTFFGIYLSIWLSQYLITKKNIKQINQKIQSINTDKE